MSATVRIRDSRREEILYPGNQSNIKSSAGIEERRGKANDSAFPCGSSNSALEILWLWYTG